MQNIAELHEQVYAHLTTKYPDLTFSLRADNRDGMLEKGYWFEGDENELIITFRKFQIIERPFFVYLKWRIDRNELLLCIDRITEENNEIQEEIVAVVDFVTNISTIWHYLRVWDKDIYLEFSINVRGITKNDIFAKIDDFLQKIEPRLIAKRKRKKEDELFYKIPQSDFQAAQALIEKYRKPKQSKQIQESEKLDYFEPKLNNLYCKNIKLIENAEIDFHQNVTCLIGENGAGKTTILRAIALAAIGNDTTNPFLKQVIQQNKVALFLKMYEKDRMPYYENEGEIRLSYQYNTENYKNTIQFNGRERKSTVSNAEDADFKLNYGDAYFRSLIIAFPQVTGKYGADSSDVKDKFPNLYDCSSLINGEADNRAAKIERWFFSLYNEALNQGAKQGIVFTKTKEYETLELVFEILSAIFNQKIEIHDTKYYGEDELTWLKIDDKILLMSLLSQGYESVMTWIGYIVKRLYEIQDHIIPPNGQGYTLLTDIPAIVLIDEIDTYLHISVQQKILAVLVEKFPNIQFIVTTHSPYTIGSIPNDKIKIYVCKKEGESVEVEEFRDFNAFGADITALSKRISGIERSVTEIEQAFKHLFNLLDEFEENPHNAALEDVINIEIEHIEKQIHHSDPELLEAKNKLILIKILNEKEEGSTI